MKVKIDRVDVLEAPRLAHKPIPDRLTVVSRFVCIARWRPVHTLFIDVLNAVHVTLMRPGSSLSYQRNNRNNQYAVNYLRNWPVPSDARDDYSQRHFEHTS